MNRKSTIPQASKVVLLAILAVVPLALRFNLAPHRHRHEELSGLTYEVPPASFRRPINLTVTSVADKGAPARAGIAAGDVIDEIDQRPIPSQAAVGAAARHDSKKGILLHVRQAGQNRYTYLPAVRGSDPGAPNVAENTRRRG